MWLFGVVRCLCSVFDSDHGMCLVRLEDFVC